MSENLANMLRYKVVRVTVWRRRLLPAWLGPALTPEWTNRKLECPGQRRERGHGDIKRVILSYLLTHHIQCSTYVSAYTTAFTQQKIWNSYWRIHWPSKTVNLKTSLSSENWRVLEKYWSLWERGVMMSTLSRLIVPASSRVKMYSSILSWWQHHYRNTVKRASCTAGRLIMEPRVSSAAPNSIKDQIQLLYFYGYWNWFLFIFKFIRFLLHVFS